MYTDDSAVLDHVVDTIHCKGDKCKSPDIEWQSSRGIYIQCSENQKLAAAVGKFICHFEGESPVTVNIMIGECEVKIILVVSFLSGLYIYHEIKDTHEHSVWAIKYSIFHCNF